METTPYKINSAAIEARKSIQVFGKIKESKGREFFQKIKTPIKLKLTSDFRDEEDSDAKPTTVYKFIPALSVVKKPAHVLDSNIYVPPSFFYEKATVKITNIPVDITWKQLEEIIAKNTGVSPNSVNIALDRETRVSRCFGFAEFNSKDLAKEVVKKIDKFKIDDFLIGAELIKEK